LFAPGVVPASSNNLVVAELMYHPPGSSQAELAAGFANGDDFEFIRLLNIGSTPSDLAGLRFSLGVAFDFAFGDVRYLAPGASVLVVKSRDAFQARYGPSFNGIIAGEYSGNLANGGERIQLLGADGVPVRDFSYGDGGPWPKAADGEGPSLVLQVPAANPDHSNPANWSVSAVPGGLPGGFAPTQSYSSWRALFWDPLEATNEAVSGPMADPDGDGVSNWLEYSFGLNPHRESAQPRLVTEVEMIGGEPFLCVSLQLADHRQDVKLTWEFSSDLRFWAVEGEAMEPVSAEPSYDGTAKLKYKNKHSMVMEPGKFVRLRVAAQ
jgi:hypothetical protein